MYFAPFQFRDLERVVPARFTVAESTVWEVGARTVAAGKRLTPWLIVLLRTVHLLASPTMLLSTHSSTKILGISS